MTSLVRVVTASEPWAEYQLEDGTLLRFRLTACNFRLTGKKTELGDPEYSFTHALQIETHMAKPVARLFAVPQELVVEHTYSAPAEDCG
jgi:hypothetical protein